MKGQIRKSGGLKTSYSLLIVVSLILFIMNSNLFAGITGKITGKIIDKATGESLPFANVILKGTMLGAATDDDGDFIIINIPPGSYDLIASYIGYASVTIKDVVVSTDRTTKQAIELSPESFQGEEVVIVAKRAAVEMDRTHSASVVNAETIDMMPVTSVSEVIGMQSGVVSEGGEMHFRGGRGREVAYLIDGIPVSNSYNQSGGVNVALENSMIQELEVISGTFNAEYGSAQSGIINVVTKRPAQEFSGNVKAYAGEWLSNNDDIFLGISDFNPLAEKNIQFSLSGPLVSDKLGIFVTGRLNSYESREWYEQRYNAIDGWKIAAYERWFKEHNVTDASSAIGIYIPDSLKTGDGSMGPMLTGYKSSFSTKLSYYPSAKVSFNYQMFGNFSDRQGTTSSVYRYQADEQSTSRSWAHSHFLTFRHFPYDNFFYNMTFSYQLNDGEGFYRKDNKIARYPGDDGIQLFSSEANGYSLGRTPQFYAGADGKGYRELFFASGDFNWQIDKYNFIKAGFEVKQHNVNTYSRGLKQTKTWENKMWPNIDELNGADYEFGEYWDSLGVYWSNWETQFADSNGILAERYEAVADSEYTQWRDYDIKPLEIGIYLQDKLELGEIVLNVGLRFDYFKANEQYPVELRTEASNLGSAANLEDASAKMHLSPRFGISFPISATGAFHVAYGHFYQMPSFQYMYNQPLYSLTKLQLNGRRLGNADLEPEKTVQYEIGLQQEVIPTLVLDITAFYKDFRNLLGIEMVTTIDAVSYTRYVNRDYGYTKGITAGITKNGGTFSGGLNYTFTYANGSSSDPNTLFLIQTATSYGGDNEQFAERKILPLNWDQRHTLNAYLNLRDGRKWSIGIIGKYESGTPYSPSFIERFDIASREYRNLAIKPNKWYVDIQAKFNLESILHLNATLFVKVDNIFDHLNETSVYSSTGSAEYNARLPENEQLLLDQLAAEGHFTSYEVDLRPNYYSAPRKIQVGLEIGF